MLIGALAVVAGFAAVLVTARHTARPAWLLAAGLLGAAGVLALSLVLMLRPCRPRFRCR